ncbi:MAG: aminotransferase, partial [Rhodococcus sp.]|nr:aminotransferase [Rhodococcus sp. (in: high G+C Gram-positive bacteria)]
EHTPAYTSAAAEAGVLLRGYAHDGVRVTIGDPHENDAFLTFATSEAGRAVAGL